MGNPNVTIFDVAKLAGVSKGTVDRVIHNRGEVSAKSAEKVRKAIAELDYEPNLYASVLASKKEYVIACIVPEAEEGSYWSMLAEGFSSHDNGLGSLGVETRLIRYDQYDVESFNEVARQVLEMKPSGVILPPLFAEASMILTDALSKTDIPYVYVDSKMDDECHLAYFGLPEYDSGVLCASLLTERCTVEEVDKIAVIRLRRQSDPTAMRRRGFMDYVRSHFPDADISSVFIDPSSKENTNEILDAFFRQYGDSKFVVMFNSRVHLAADYLLSHPVKGRRVIGFDNLPKNLEMLQSVDDMLLITQHIDRQARLAVSTLVDYVVLHKKPAARDNYMHMDIITKFNIENY